MNKRFRLLACVLFLVATKPLFARDKSDVLIMKNGDRVQCEVKGLNAGVLYVGFDWADGDVSVDWSKVERLESTQLFVVKTAGGAVYTGSFRTPKTEADQPVSIQVVDATKTEPVVINRTQLVSIVQTSSKFWHRFDGEVGFGSTYSKANESAQYNLNAQTTYVEERWDSGVYYQSNLSSVRNGNPSTRNSLLASYQHLLRNENWFLAGLGGFLQSTEQQITLQETLGGGIGRFLKRSNSTSISLVGGGAWQSTNYNRAEISLPQQNVAAALIYGNAKFFRFSKTNLDFTGTVLPALNDLGRVRSSINATYYIKIISDLKWNISFYGNWDNRPPTGIPGSDYGSSSGLTWTYGFK
jgi:hypothetical protein